jgi:hypothetical protein
LKIIETNGHIIKEGKVLRGPYSPIASECRERYKIEEIHYLDAN